MDPQSLFFAGIARNTGALVAGITVDEIGGEHWLGAAVGKDHRSRGYGSETLAACQAVLHRHFGIGRLLAGTEVGNPRVQPALSQVRIRGDRWTGRRALPDGRIMQSLWWQHVDEAPVRDCRHLHRSLAGRIWRQLTGRSR